LRPTSLSILCALFFLCASCTAVQPELPGSTATETFTNTPDAAPLSTVTPALVQDPVQTAETLSWQVINTYPHDPQAFTEGLTIHKNELYETTGLNGSSSVRKVDLLTGEIQQISYLPREYFGEGLAIVDQRLIWLTWKSNTAFVYDLNSFEQTGSFAYPHEGWGLAYDGVQLYMSDGTDTLHILDAGTYAETATLQVQDNGEPVTMINELEFIEGQLFANIWLTNKIARIDPHTGAVTGWLDLSALAQETAAAANQSIDVLNGIAYNDITQQIYVTGKYWPNLYEIQIISSDQAN